MSLIGPILIKNDGDSPDWARITINDATGSITLFEYASIDEFANNIWHQLEDGKYPNKLQVFSPDSNISQKFYCLLIERNSLFRFYFNNDSGLPLLGQRFHKNPNSTVESSGYWAGVVNPAMNGVTANDKWVLNKEDEVLYSKKYGQWAAANYKLLNGWHGVFAQQPLDFIMDDFGNKKPGFTTELSDNQQLEVQSYIKMEFEGLKEASKNSFEYCKALSLILQGLINSSDMCCFPVVAVELLPENLQGSDFNTSFLTTEGLFQYDYTTKQLQNVISQEVLLNLNILTMHGDSVGLNNSSLTSTQLEQLDSLIQPQSGHFILPLSMDVTNEAVLARHLCLPNTIKHFPEARMYSEGSPMVTVNQVYEYIQSLLKNEIKQYFPAWSVKSPKITRRDDLIGYSRRVLSNISTNTNTNTNTNASVPDNSTSSVVIEPPETVSLFMIFTRFELYLMRKRRALSVINQIVNQLPADQQKFVELFRKFLTDQVFGPTPLLQELSNEDLQALRSVLVDIQQGSSRLSSLINILPNIHKWEEESRANFHPLNICLKEFEARVFRESFRRARSNILADIDSNRPNTDEQLYVNLLIDDAIMSGNMFLLQHCLSEHNLSPAEMLLLAQIKENLPENNSIPLVYSLIQNKQRLGENFKDIMQLVISLYPKEMITNIINEPIFIGGDRMVAVTPLWESIGKNEVDILFTSIPMEQRVDVIKGYYNGTLLHLAIKKASHLTVKFLLNNIPPNQVLNVASIKDIACESILHVAVRADDRNTMLACMDIYSADELMPLLLEENVDKQTVLQLAIHRNSLLALDEILNAIPYERRLQMVNTPNSLGISPVQSARSNQITILYICDSLPREQQATFLLENIDYIIDESFLSSVVEILEPVINPLYSSASSLARNSIFSTNQLSDTRQQDLENLAYEFSAVQTLTELKDILQRYNTIQNIYTNESNFGADLQSRIQEAVSVPIPSIPPTLETQESSNQELEYITEGFKITFQKLQRLREDFTNFSTAIIEFSQCLNDRGAFILSADVDSRGALAVVRLNGIYGSCAEHLSDLQLHYTGLREYICDYHEDVGENDEVIQMHLLDKYLLPELRKIEKIVNNIDEVAKSAKSIGQELELMDYYQNMPGPT